MKKESELTLLVCRLARYAPNAAVALLTPSAMSMAFKILEHHREQQRDIFSFGSLGWREASRDWREGLALVYMETKHEIQLLLLD